VVALIQESGICDVKVKCLGIPDEFVEQGSQAILRSKYGLDAKGIAQQVLNLIRKSSPGSLSLSSFNIQISQLNFLELT
jgi:deoxyxylulose-5-phosphate synthase